MARLPGAWSWWASSGNSALIHQCSILFQVVSRVNSNTANSLNSNREISKLPCILVLIKKALPALSLCFSCSQIRGILVHFPFPFLNQLVPPRLSVFLPQVTCVPISQFSFPQASLMEPLLASPCSYQSELLLFFEPFLIHQHATCRWV